MAAPLPHIKAFLDDSPPQSLVLLDELGEMDLSLQPKLLRALAAPLLLIGTVVVSFFAALGVSFVVSSFVLTDGLLRTFNDIVEDANAEVDVEVRAVSHESTVPQHAPPVKRAATSPTSRRR